MNNILLIEDDKALSLGIEFTLKDEGFNVLSASSFESGKNLYDNNNVDLVILDINLPDGNGYELCKYIRAKSETPIIFLTALDEEVNVVLGFDLGGDDYITKPFRVKELISRIKAILRRSSKESIKGNRLISGDIELDLSLAELKKKGSMIPLTAQEYKLIFTLMTNSNTIMKREEILKEIIGSEDVFYDENTLSVYIKRIREKIEDNPKEPQYIITKRGLGYKWEKEVSQE